MCQTNLMLFSLELGGARKLGVMLSLCSVLCYVLVSKLGKWEILPLWVDRYLRSSIPKRVINSPRWQALQIGFFWGREVHGLNEGSLLFREAVEAIRVRNQIHG